MKTRPIRSGGLDRQLIVCTIALIAFGLAILYSAGQTDVASAADGVWKRQLVWLGIGSVAAILAYRVSPRILEWLAPGAYGLALFLLVLVLATGAGAGTAAGSRSWLSVAGVHLGQPAELAKLAVILMLARYLSGRRDPPGTLRELIVPSLIAGIPFFLVLQQPDLGSALVFVGILFAMLFWSGVRLSLLFLFVSPVVSLLLAFQTNAWGLWMIFLLVFLLVLRPYVVEGIVVYVANAAMGAILMPVWQRLAPYQQKRLLTFVNPEADPLGAGYHAIQSKIAIGSGGWLGQGYLQGPQKRLAFLPEQHTDFIFPIVGEELGFVGVFVALILFLALLLILLRISRRAIDPFASLIAFGVLGLLFTHVFENVGMTVNLMPITGIPLPFFSYGGSFLLTSAIGIGLALRVAWDSRFAGYVDM